MLVCSSLPSSMHWLSSRSSALRGLSHTVNELLACTLLHPGHLPWYARLPACLPVLYACHLPACLSVKKDPPKFECLPVSLVCLSGRLCICIFCPCLCVHLLPYGTPLSVCLCVCLSHSSVCLSVCVSAFLCSVCLPACLCVCVCVCVPMPLVSLLL